MEEITCTYCEADFIVETDWDVLYCVHCGHSLEHNKWNSYRDSDDEGDYDEE